MRLIIRLFFKTVRRVLAPFVVTIDRITTPKGIDRPAGEQARVDKETLGLTLYHFQSCPFCIKTRRAMKRLALNIELRDVQRNSTYRSELQAGGGEVKVPCLRIANSDGGVQWMYESADIIDYINRRFGPSDPNTVKT